MKNLAILALAGSFALAGCRPEPESRTDYFVDLNDDKKVEIIANRAVSRSRGGVPIDFAVIDFEVTARFSNQNDSSYTQPRLLLKSRIEPKEINFVDFDGDGDMDMVFSAYVLRNPSAGISFRSFNYDTFLAENNGTGNFSAPRIINSKRYK